MPSSDAEDQELEPRTEAIVHCPSKGDLLLHQHALDDRASCVERALLASWVRGAVLARHLVLVVRVLMPGCWGPPRIVLLRGRPSTSAAASWQKLALGELRGGRISCVGWGRYELRRHRSGELITSFRPEPPTHDTLALTPTSLDRLREIERHCWGPWRRARAPVLGQVCEARWGPIAACPPEVLTEAARIATTKAAQLGISCRLMRIGSTDSAGSDASTTASSSDSISETSGEQESHKIFYSPCEDGNTRPFLLRSIDGELCKPEELRQSSHQIAALSPVRPEPGWVCAICLHGVPEDAPDQTPPVCDAVASHGLLWHQLPCGHVFHKGCVLPWIRSGKPCPLGRCTVPNAARHGRREMIFPMASGWRELPPNVVADDILAPSQTSVPRPSCRVPPHLRNCRLTPNTAFFESLALPPDEGAESLLPCLRWLWKGDAPEGAQALTAEAELKARMKIMK